MKRKVSSSSSSDDDDDDDDGIFSYSNKRALTFNNVGKSATTTTNSSSDSDDSDESSSSSDDDENEDECVIETKSTLVNGEDNYDDSPPPSPPPPPPVDELKLDTPVHAENSILRRLREERMKGGTPSTIGNSSLIFDDSIIIDEDEEMAVKIRIHGMVVRYHISKCKPLAELFQMIANNEETPVNSVKLSLKNNILKETDTPDKVNLNVASIVECIISEKLDLESDDKNSFVIKVQSDKKRARKEYTVNKTKNLLEILKKFCVEHDENFDGCIFEFDGETFDPNSTTPDSIGIEEGDIIDVIT